MYLIYGMYSCMNIAAMREDIPQAVLLRSVIPADAQSERIMLDLRLAPLNQKRKRAGKESNIKKHLADGPGKLCIAMGISRSDNDVDMTKSKEFYVTEGQEIRTEEIKAGKRIGIDYAGEAADYLWRFYL